MESKTGQQAEIDRLNALRAEDAEHIGDLTARLSTMLQKVDSLRLARDSARVAYFDGNADDQRDLLSGYHLGLSTALLLFADPPKYGVLWHQAQDDEL